MGERTTFTFTFSSQEFKDSCTGSQFSGGHTLHGFISFTSDPVQLDITPKSLNPIKITLTCDGDQYPLEVEIQGS